MLKLVFFVRGVEFEVGGKEDFSLYVLFEFFIMSLY